MFVFENFSLIYGYFVPHNSQSCCLIQRKDCAVLPCPGETASFSPVFAIDRRRMLPTSTEAPAQSAGRAVPPAMAGTVQRHLPLHYGGKQPPSWWAGLQFGALSRLWVWESLSRGVHG